MEVEIEEEYVGTRARFNTTRRAFGGIMTRVIIPDLAAPVSSIGKSHLGSTSRASSRSSRLGSQVQAVVRSVKPEQPCRIR